MKHTWKWAALGAATGLLVLLVFGFIFQDELRQLVQKDVNVLTEQGVNADALVTSTDVNLHYNGSVHVDFDNHMIEGSLQVKAINKTNKDQDAIYFHLYPNVFRESDKLRGENWEYVLGEDRESGWIDIRNVHINGKEASYVVNDTLLEIPVDMWKSNEELTVDLQFTLQVPKNSGRLSYDESSIWLGNWLPIVAEYDENGWYLDPYYPVGDPFYSDIANYALDIDVPAGFQIASSGIESDQIVTQNGDRVKYQVSVEKVRDFALVIMDDSYQVIQENVDGLTVNTWYRSKNPSANAKMIHKAGVDSLTYFSQAYGAYPYKEYDIVQTGGFFGGMEYPGIVFIQGIYFERSDDYGILVTAHETAHQWWYGLVGNNEVDDPWMDESLTEYSTLRFLMDNKKRIGQDYLSRKESSLNFMQTFEQRGEYVGSSLEEFTNWNSYGALVYNKGPMMFYKLEQAIGLEKMNEILRDYFRQYQYRNASDEQLIQVFEKHLGEPARIYFQSWLEGGEAEFKGE